MQRFAFAFVLILGLAAWGCGGGDDQSGGHTGKDTNEPDVLDWDTTGNDTVVPGDTTPDTTPGCDPACGAGYHCEGTTCVADPVGCDPACGTGYHCEGSTCVADPAGCDPACGAGFHCEGTTCVADPVACNPSCELGFACVDGNCVAAPACEGSGNVTALKACAEGPSDFTLTGVVVTYVYDKGYFVADASGGMQIYVGDVWPYTAPVVGDKVDVHVTEYGSYMNSAEAKVTDTLTPKGTGDAAALTLDLSAGTEPVEALENRAVKGTGFTVTQLGGQNGLVSYGTAVDVPLRLDVPAGLCVGATFDLAAGVIVQFQDTYRLQTFHAATDVVNVNAAGCSTFDASNWNFEEDGSQDPPADFAKGSDGFVANVTADQAHAGSHACQLTWTSQDNQDLYQGLYLPIVAGQTAHFTLWVMDNDPAGRVRPSLEFYDAAKASVGKEYDGYSEDNPAWVQMTYDLVAPENAVYVRAFVRLYDVSGAWAGTATVYVDDWSLTVQ